MFSKPSLHFTLYGALALLFFFSTAIATAQVTGTGTPNRVTKWVETSRIGDSTVTETIIETPTGTKVNVSIGFGIETPTPTPTPTPPHALSVRRNLGTAGVHNNGELFVIRDSQAARSASLAVGTRNEKAEDGGLKWIIGMPAGNDGFQVFDLLAPSAQSQSRFFIDGTDGNVGIGTTTPRVKLDVLGSIKAVGLIEVLGRIRAVGNISTDRDYHIGEQRVLSVAGSDNLFAGENAGTANTSGEQNAFFGRAAGAANTIGSRNSFFGRSAGNKNTTGGNNSFFGTYAGFENTEGRDNSFFGRSAGSTNTAGTDNTIIGANADVGSPDLIFATAIGANAVVSTSNTVALGRASGQDTVRVPGRLVIGTLGAGGGAPLCRNAQSQVTGCFGSSLRYKRDVNPLVGGLDLVRQLRPITFRWKTDGTLDAGFGAEEVARVAPLFVMRNAAGEVEGVKYGQLSAVLVNAVQEQQRQIQARDARISELETRLAQLERIVLSQRRPSAQPRRRR